MSQSNFVLKKITSVIPGLELHSGDEEMDNYFNSDIYNEVELGNTMGYLLFVKDIFVGFFTLSNSKMYLPLSDTTKNWPATLLGRLALQLELVKNGYGSLMINLAKKISFDTRTTVASRLLILKTYKKELVDTFFKKNGFFVSNEKATFTELYYDLNDWPLEEEEFFSKWNIDL